MKSTSINRINGSKKDLKKHEKLIYFVSNYINNLFPCFFVDKNLEIRHFYTTELEEKWGKVSKEATPSRVFSDLFWMSLPWASIKSELGKIFVADIGCGKGEYYKKLQSWAGEKFDGYTGVDIYSHKEHKLLAEKNSNCNFIICQAELLENVLPPETNLIITQSAIGQFKEDIIFFKNILKHCQNTKKPVIQIHLCRSEACLALYMFLGFRQYTPRTLSKITSLFTGFSDTILFKLGGRLSNKLHSEYIPRSFIGRLNNDYRMQKKEQYSKDLKIAVAGDMKNPKPPPSFYALVIHSNKNKSIFNG